MHKVYFGIGGNLGNKKDNLLRCKELVEKQIGFVKTASSIYETPPWGFDANNNFWNQVLLVETEILLHELLVATQKIEDDFQKKVAQDGYASREMDVDILLYDQEVVNTADLVIPHPQMHKRNFVLVPITEISPDEVHPILGRCMADLLKDCTDNSPIKKM